MELQSVRRFARESGKRGRLDLAAVRRSYQRYAPIYDATFGWLLGGRGRWLAAEIANERAGPVLEIGVGTGLTLRHYRKDHRVIGIDVSPEMLARAQLRIARSNGHGQVMKLAIMDAGRLAFPDATFEAVIAAYVVSVVPDPGRVIAEIERVCRPGGDVVLVNHFRAANGVRAAVEKRLAPLSDKLGWRPDFGIEEVLSRTKLELVETTPLPPFGLFTLLRFRKRPEPNAAGAAGDSPSTSGRAR